MIAVVEKWKKRLFFRNFGFISCEAEWFAWANVISEIRCRRIRSVSRISSCEQLPLQFSFRDLFTTRHLVCRSCCLGKLREAQRSRVVLDIVLAGRCLLLYFGLKNSNLVSSRRRILFLTNPTISWRKGWLAQWNGGKGEAERLKSFFMMQRLNQFQVSELFPLLNFRRQTAEEVQKESQELAHR